MHHAGHSTAERRRRASSRRGRWNRLLRFAEQTLAVSLLAWGLAAISGVSPARAELADRILVVVGARVVTASDVRFEQAIQPHIDCPVEVLCHPERSLQDRLVDYAIIRGLAAEAAIYQPSPEEVERRLAYLRTRFTEPASWQAFLERFGLTEYELAGWLFSRMVVERYVQRNVVMLVRATGGDEADMEQRYREWIGRQRARLRIREVDLMEELDPVEAGGPLDSPDSVEMAD